MSNTAHLDISLLEASQAQKEVTMNEALNRLDALMNTGVLDQDRTTPPTAPEMGDVYIVAAGASNEWAGHDNEIAYFEQVWRFITPREGLVLWVNDEAALYVYETTGWRIVETGSAGDGSGSGGSATLGNNSVTTSKIADGAVTAPKLANDIFATIKEDASATSTGVVQLADNVAINAGTAGRVVDAAQLANAVAASNSAATPSNGSVTTDKIADGAVTAPKLATDIFTTIKEDASATTTGVVQLADNAAIDAGTAGRVVDAAQLATAIASVDTGSGSATGGGSGATVFKVTEPSVTIATKYTFPHGLGTKPDMVQVRIICTSNDGPYVVGEELLADGSQLSGGSDYNACVSVTDSDVIIRTGDNTFFGRTDNGNFFGLTESRWEMKIMAVIF